MDDKRALPAMAGLQETTADSAALEASRTPRPQLLVCPPRHFGVDYVINPWMQGQIAAVDRARAQGQWQGLREHLAAHAQLRELSPVPGLPDLVFTANAGLVLGADFVPSRFRHAERQGEEAHFVHAMRGAGFRIRPLREGLAFEGAGDALLDRGSERRLWLGHGHRSEQAAATDLAAMLALEVVPLRLVDPRFYHLDTCFCPLRGGALLYYPAAFDAASRAAIAACVPADRRIEVDETDALAFACNAVDLGRVLVLHRASAALRQRLSGFGYAVVETPLDEFLKSGGSAKCLTLRLDE